MNKDKSVNILDKIIEWAFYILIAAVTFATSVVEICAATIIIAYFLKKILQKDFSFPKHIFLAIFGIFILWNLVSFFNTDYFNESIRGVLKVIKYGLILTISIDVFKTKNILKSLTYVLVIWSVIVALDGIAQSILGFDILRLRTMDTLDYLHRISACFRHANNFGAYLVVIIPVFLSFIFSNSINLRNKIYFFMGLLPLSFCLARTSSRGAWLAASLAVLILSFLKSKKLFIILIVLFIILPFILPQQMKARAFDVLNFHEGTGWERLKLWGQALTMVREHPFLGFGVNTYTKNVPAFKSADYWNAIYPHNCYLQMAAEIGLIGLGLFLTFAILAFVYIGRCLKFLKEGWMRSVAVGLFAGLIGFLMHSAVDTHLYSPNLAVMFYFLLGFCIALCNYAKNNPA